MSRTRKLVRKNRSQARHLKIEGLESRKLLAAEILQVEIENLAAIGGLTETPFWVSLHDRSFDIANPGESAAGFGGLELIAEEGDPSQLVSRFADAAAGNDAVMLAPGGFAGAPVLEPGESVIENLIVDDTQSSRFFSFASMVIPSNDAFVANLETQAYELFDAAGSFLGPRTIVIYGDQVWDAGTEVNDASAGAAFSTLGGASVDQNGVVTHHTGLDDFIGTGLPTGTDLTTAFSPQTPLARITLSLASDPSEAIDDDAPLAVLDAADLDSSVDFHEINVTYTDATGIDPTSIDVDDIRVTSPFLTRLDVLSVSTDAAAGTTPRTVTATYRVAPENGGFTSVDNGIYSVVLHDGAVGDAFDQTVAGQQLGQFAVDAPVRLQVTIENLSADGGLAQTPFWIAAHNGEFEVARGGVSADDFAGLEALAETGDAGGLAARFAATSGGVDALLTAPDGFAGAPVFETGESISQFLDVDTPGQDRYFSYASMIIPSNDAFIANLDPRRFELFDRSGNFTGARSITIYGSDIWDAGTEVNDPAGGAAFTTVGGVGADEDAVVRRHDGLDEFLGSGLPTGENLASAFDLNTPIARITISLADIPANPIDGRGPQATVDAGDLMMAGEAFHEVHVTYSDPSGIDIGSIDAADVQVVGTFTDPLEVLSVSTDAAAGTTPNVVHATYRVAPRSGEFSTFDNDIYHVNVVQDAVNDTLGNASEAASLGSFEVLVGVKLQVTIENLSPFDGLAQTPFWIGFHDGNFEVARTGVAADQFVGLELLAEEGDASELSAAFAASASGIDTVIGAPDGFAAAPVFEPGETATQTIELFSTNVNRYFSFASMIIPSNDAFLANLNSRAYQLFDSDGVFGGQQTITIYGSDVLDAGTEVNDPNGGAAFATAGGTSIDQGGVIGRHQGLDDFLGAGLPTGGTLESVFFAQTPLARITIGLAGGSSTPIDADGPIASLEGAADVTVAGTENHQIQITYNDPAGIDLTRIGVDDLRVSGPLGRQLVVTDAVYDATDGPAPRSVTVTYTVQTDDGPFTGRDNGRYAISVDADAVGDTLTHGNEAQAVGEFFVDVGVRLQIQIESLTADGGLSQTPFWIGFHDGGFETGRAGTPASQFGGLELIAEEGDPSELAARFAAENSGVDSVIASPAGFAGAPVFEAGESVTQLIEVTDSQLNRYFSYASMVIPSNDAFVANLDPRQFSLFDANGNFQGARSLTITGRGVWDAGTEVNDPSGGAAFSTEGGSGADENGLIRSHAGLNDFIGTGLPTGTTLASAFDYETPLARITITLYDPEADACSGVTGACSVSSVGLQNRRIVSDVNDSGTVEPLDALLIINFLNRFGTTPSIAEEARALDLFLDVSDDDQISPIDALIVINQLNRGSGSATDNAADAAFAAFSADSQGLDDDDDDELLVQESNFI
ncbi:spondin domain-containing protein [Rosistilla oblonga]|uniref:spondin domain-containing protein n=1 Tax=Rosistilla oblonga TaxID=2527990 RepID=UPI003A97E491